MALIPAAGHARRLPGLDRSKEIVPVASAADGRGGHRPKAICEYLLEALALAGIRRGFMVLRRGKEDVPAYLGGLPRPQLDLTFLTIDESPSVPHTLDRAYSHLGGARVALGFPDILVRPANAFAALLERQRASGADLVLGLFPTRHPERADMVQLDGRGRPRRLLIKQATAGLRYTWSIAVWTPRLGRFLHQELARHRPPAGRELYVGDLFQAALEGGIEAAAVAFPDGDSLDVGEPEGLAAARRELAAKGRRA